MNRVYATKSEGFFKNIPISKLDNVRKYDVGCTFLEDVIRFYGRVLNHNIENEYFTHLEGMSWYSNSNEDVFIKKYKDNLTMLSEEYCKYNEFDIKGVRNG